MNIKDFLKVMKDMGFNEVIVDNNSPLNEKIKLLNQINQEIQNCTKCDLHKNRKQAVLGEGNPNSPIMFIGEAPGEEEDKQGRPFVGRA
ncbi:MAG: uracil-DNA glycosylase family protein, partial [Sulfurihydrogenibium azorense]